jgi:hypothetical protein
MAEDNCLVREDTERSIDMPAVKIYRYFTLNTEHCRFHVHGPFTLKRVALRPHGSSPLPVLWTTLVRVYNLPNGIGGTDVGVSFDVEKDK